MKQLIKHYHLIGALLLAALNCEAQISFHSYWSGYLPNTFSRQSIPVDKSKILDVGFTCQDTLENWYWLAAGDPRPFLSKTDYAGNIVTGCSGAYQYYYDISTPLGTPISSDIKSVTTSKSTGNYFMVGNFVSYNQEKLYIAEVDQNCGDIVNIVQINTPFGAAVPTKIIEYNGTLYCIGYAKHYGRTDYDMFIIEADPSLASVTIVSYFNMIGAAINDENCYPYDIMGRLNPVTHNDELVIIGEVNKIDALAGPKYDHPYAFFSVFDLSLSITDFKCYPYDLVAGTEGTWARCFTEFNRGSEYLMPVMVDHTITAKTVSLLKLDYSGNLVSHFEIENLANSCCGKMYPTSIHATVDKAIITSMEFSSAFGSATNNFLNNDRLVNILEVDVAGPTVTDWKHIMGPYSTHINSYSTIYDQSADRLYVKGTYLDHGSSTFNTFQTVEDNDMRCYKTAYPITSSYKDIVDISLPLPARAVYSPPLFPLITTKVSARNNDLLCYSPPPGKMETGLQDNSLRKITEEQVKRVLVVDLLGRTIINIDLESNPVDRDQIQAYLAKELHSKGVFIVNLFDSNDQRISSFKYTSM